jgi:hypothetical protein
VVELLPAFAKNEVGVNEREIGILWAVNSLVIVVAQLPIAKLAEGRRRMARARADGVDLGARDARGRAVRALALRRSRPPSR